MKFKIYLTATALAMLLTVGCIKSMGDHNGTDAKTSDTALHLLAPEYPMPYGTPTKEGVKAKMDTVLQYLYESTPMRLVNKATGDTLTDLSEISADHTFDTKFRLSSYEWGVTYSAMLAAAEATGDPEYRRYVDERLRYMATLYPYLRTVFDRDSTLDASMLKMVDPRALDDGGAICTAMMKARMTDPSMPVDSMINNYFDYIVNKEYRLADGTFARNRPQHNTVWLDDMFMGIPSLAVMGTYASDPAYYNAATKQVRQFAERMFVPEKRLFRHGWVEGMTDHPSFFWGRANGWAILTMCEVLDQLPDDHPDRQYIISLLQEHVRGLAPLQGNDGLWHQLLDRPDTYGETSATAIYVYALAHAINKGWIDAKAYGPVAVLGWNALADHIQSDGQITGTCVGTGMGFDPAFYAHRPVSAKAAHIYGPTIWAGAEMIKLLDSQHLQINDSAVQFYDEDPEIDQPIFELTADHKGRLVQ